MPSAPSSSGPQTPWVVHSLFDMQAQIGQWKAAQETLDTGLRRKVVTPDKGRTLKALLLVERSRAAERDGSAGRCAGAGARGVRRWRPSASPSPSGWPSCRSRRATARRAMKTLERGWALAPHPDLAALYLKASGETDPLKRVGIVRRLAAQKPDDLESHLALAQASLDAGLWGEARRHLEAAGGTSPSVRVCRMMAEVEERAHSDQAKVHDWLARAADAPADRAWRCSACGAHHESWRPVCESCGAFGTLQWRAPGTFGQVLPPETRQRRQSSRHDRRSIKEGKKMFETTLAGSLPKPSWLATPNVLWAPWTLTGAPLFEAKDDATAARHPPPGRGRHRHRERRRAGAAAFRARLPGRGRRRRLRQEGPHGHPQQPLRRRLPDRHRAAQAPQVRARARGARRPRRHDAQAQVHPARPDDPDRHAGRRLLRRPREDGLRLRRALEPGGARTSRSWAST